ncbi:MAG: hypothetical protein Ct9H300mP28_10590 [Pseudomonadota bacterium]|nr:MAG: hypothetical protein Ct9H300mP28_10590 [Pseudomonadota bacterium]
MQFLDSRISGSESAQAEGSSAIQTVHLLRRNTQQILNLIP